MGIATTALLTAFFMATPDIHPSDIRHWAAELGFADAGITNVRLDEHETHLLNWLQQGFHGDMDYMQRHGTLRSRPSELLPGTVSVISVRMEYFPPDTADEWTVLKTPEQAYISRYALGRDYHKLMRNRLQSLAKKIEEAIGPFGYRAFVDSAPVLEKALAEKAGLGWIGKHTNVVNPKHGSWFFLGELFTDLPLPESESAIDHCGRCNACIDICPTQAILGPRQLDARRCISYLTIEHSGSIPTDLRPLLGNRIYGCDDCQLVCPWNRFSQRSDIADFAARHQLDRATLLELFAWSEEEFLERFAGSAIRRIGHQRWLRNIAVALGNGVTDDKVIAALEQKRRDSSAMVQEHIDWALQRLTESPP